MHVFTIVTYIRTLYGINTVNSLGEGLGKVMEVVVGTKIKMKTLYIIIATHDCSKA